MTNETNLTEKEIEVLRTVAQKQIEDNYSQLISVDSDEQKGVLGSLVNKELVYNCYDGMVMDMGYMYCLTEQGFIVCRSLNIDTEHIIFHC